VIAHWGEVERERLEQGEIAAWATDLGTAAGSVDVGVTRYELDPGRRSSPVHVELVEEEIFYVLGGSGLLWQNGETYEVGAGDCVAARASEHMHAFVAGDDGLDLLAFGQRADPPMTYLPRAGIVRAGVTLDVSTGPHPWEREAAAGPLELPPPSPRPSNVVNVEDVEVEERDGATVARRKRDLGMAAGSVRTGIRLYEPFAGKLAVPPHCHSAEEEIFLVIDGEGALLLGEEEHSVRRGHVVARPPGTGVAHTFRGPLAYLAYGTREPNDIVYYPRSNKFFLRGIGLIGRIQPLDYWEGED
jgi:uncharacterized cupin superfamily protein